MQVQKDVAPLNYLSEIKVMNTCCNETHELSDWVTIRDLPWSDWFVYKLLSKYPNDILTVLVNVSGDGERGKRLISKKSVEALLSRLAAEQSADPDAAAKRAAYAQKRHLGRKQAEVQPV